jgi:tRNA(fMet)-specific endonuclease VapC
VVLLDSNVCIKILNGDVKIGSRLTRLPPEEIALCSIVKAELVFGALKSKLGTRNTSRYERFMRPYTTFAFDDSCVRKYAEIRLHLENLKPAQGIGPNDLLIASIALTHDLTPVTHNIHEFSRIPDLKLEDWEV